MIRPIAILTAALAMSVTATSTSACDIGGVNIVGGAIDARYDVFSSADLSTPIRLTSTGDPDCAGVLVRLRIQPDETDPNAASGGLRLSNGAAFLRADISDRSGRARLGQASSAGVSPVFRLNATGGLDAGELTLTMPRGQRSPPGSFIGRFQLVTEALGEDGDVVSSQAVSAVVLVEVAPSVSLSAAWGAQLDLGEIRSGGRSLKPLSFRAYANTPYEISIKSDNKFDLVRESAIAGPTIPYVPVLSDTVLPSGSERTREFLSPGNAGYRDHSLDVEVPLMEPRAAGDYHDYLTVEIRAVVTG